jgi:CRISPR-associated protein Cas5d
MYHSIIYADEAMCPEDQGQMTVCFHTPVMKNGVIRFIKPEDCTVKRHIKPEAIKVFTKEAYTPVDEMYEEVKCIELDE